MNYLKRKLENWVLRRLLNAVTESEIFDNISGDKLTSYQLQADDLLKTSLFKDLLTEMRRVACIQMFNKSQTLDDIRYAKAMLHSIDVMEKKVIALSKGFVDIAREQGRGSKMDMS